MVMKKIVLLASLTLSVVLLIMVSCNMSPYRGYKKTDSGLYYKFHSRSGDTALAQIGDLMTLDIKWGTEDSTLFDSKSNPRPWIIPQMQSQYKGDIYEAFSLMKVGDSATFIIEADSFFLVTANSPMIPEFIDSNGVLFFDIKLISAMTQQDFEKAKVLEDEKAMQEESGILQKYLTDNNITSTPTESGLYYMETVPGNGKLAKEGDWLKIHFAITLIDNTPIYSSFNGEPRSAEFGKPFENNGVTEAISKMSEGTRANIIVPSSLGFGKQGRGEIIPPFATLLYDIQVVDVLTAAEYKADQEKLQQQRKQKEEANLVNGKRFLDQNSKKEGVVTLPSGLQYKVLTMGNGPKPSATDVVKVHYTGTLINGTEFDSSVKRGQPATFRVNGVIQGWTEALQLMPVGSKWTLYVPSELAYKNQQRGEFIEPNMALVFDVELIEIMQE
jgi:FKBP-type peptidyl-prolyl cis-trans isomerase